MVRWALNYLIQISSLTHKFKVQQKKSVQKILQNQEAMVGIGAVVKRS